MATRVGSRAPGNLFQGSCRDVLLGMHAIEVRIFSHFGAISI